MAGWNPGVANRMPGLDFLHHNGDGAYRSGGYHRAA